MDNCIKIGDQYIQTYPKQKKDPESEYTSFILKAILAMSLLYILFNI